MPWRALNSAKAFDVQNRFVIDLLYRSLSNSSELIRRIVFAILAIMKSKSNRYKASGKAEELAPKYRTKL